MKKSIIIILACLGISISACDKPSTSGYIWFYENPAYTWDEIDVYVDGSYVGTTEGPGTSYGVDVAMSNITIDNTVYAYDIYGNTWSFTISSQPAGETLYQELTP